MIDISEILTDCDAFLVSNPRNIRYLCDFIGASETEREAFLLLTLNGWLLYTYRLYEQEANAVLTKYSHIQVRFLEPNKRLADYIAAEYSNKRVGFESTNLFYAEYSRLQSVTTLIPTTGKLEQLRVYKQEKEIKKLTDACILTDRCFEEMITQIKPGVTEIELAWKIESYIRRNNATLSFSPIVAFNEHSAIPHHIPDVSRLTTTSLILLDFGAALEGYHADLTRMIVVGTPKPEWITAYQTLQTAQQAALHYLDTPTASGANADEQARSVITNAGYPIYPHSLGHGLGLDIHEDPRLSIHHDRSLEPGMVFTVEPGIYLPGQFGMRLEDVVLKTKDGIEVLSKTRNKLLVL